METFTSQATDLSWVTFLNENPAEPCEFQNCDQEADWLTTCLPCGHEYKFCDSHMRFTHQMLNSTYIKLYCADCGVDTFELIEKPLTKG